MANRRLFGRWRRRRGGRLPGALAGLAAGAGLVYFLDPRRGPGRRSQAVQRAGRVAREMEATVEAGARDLSQRVRGIAHKARMRMARDLAPDEVVIERVRARLGRLSAHPHAIRVSCRGGHVELTGPALRAEHARVVRGVRMVRGVREVEDHLDLHETAEGVSLLHGAPAPGPAHEMPQTRWSPGARLVAGVTGAFLVLRALVGRGLMRIPAGLAGGALIARVLSESEPARREARRTAGRARGESAARAREGRREAEAHGGAWHPEAETREERREVQEVKSPAELEPGSPERPGTP